MKYSEAERKLKAAGCYWFENGASHPLWFSPITKNKFPLSYHRSEEIKQGTLKSISKLSGVKL
ncbi:MAG: type II toxin-antitoxin system HicA family toxin [Prevotellaceae bacterium]|nr:type II toxin-antitoxin system HicA family toxin [Prevotellaceae bacterium]